MKAAEVVPLPDGVSFHDGGAIILQGLTAHYLVHEFYPIKRGSTVLVHAAAGGMGLLLVQWLKHMGAAPALNIMLKQMGLPPDFASAVKRSTQR